MIANSGNLAHFARLARAAQMRGEQTICFQIDALRGYSKYVKLWEDTTGEVVGRAFEDPGEPSVPGIARPRVVKYFTVRIRVADVLEAWRRRQQREAHQFGSIAL
jgi:hypothetical protein